MRDHIEPDATASSGQDAGSAKVTTPVYEQSELFPEPEPTDEDGVICYVVHDGPCPPIGGHH